MPSGNLIDALISSRHIAVLVMESVQCPLGTYTVCWVLCMHTVVVWEMCHGSCSLQKHIRLGALQAYCSSWGCCRGSCSLQEPIMFGCPLGTLQNLLVWNGCGALQEPNRCMGAYQVYCSIQQYGMGVVSRNLTDAWMPSRHTVQYLVVSMVQCPLGTRQVGCLLGILQYLVVWNGCGALQEPDWVPSRHTVVSSCLSWKGWRLGTTYYYVWMPSRPTVTVVLSIQYGMVQYGMVKLGCLLCILQYFVIWNGCGTLQESIWWVPSRHGCLLLIMLILHSTQ